MEKNNYNILCIMVAIASLVLVGLTTPAKSQEANVVDDLCLACICDASSGCNVTRACNGDVCGLFGITWFYWADSGKLTVDGDTEESPMAFQNCAIDPTCASQIVQNYMQKFRQDCNQDGKIDCLDYASIHRLGGYGCPGRIFGSYATTLNQCLASRGTEGTENSEELPPPPAEMPNPDITPLGAPQTINVTEQPQIVSEIPQVPSIDGSVQNFDFAMEPIKENAADIPKGSGDNSVGNTTDLPPLTLLQFLRPKINTTTPSSIDSSELEQIFANLTEMTVQSQDTTITGSNDNSISSIPGANGTQLIRGTDRFFEILERMEKSKNDHTDRLLSVQEKFLEAFLNKNRIEEEKNQILKEITANNNNFSGNDVQQLNRRAIENSQSRFIESLERMEKSENEHRENQLRFQEKFLEAFMNKNRIAEERNNVLKEVANSNKQPTKTAPNYFLL